MMAVRPWRQGGRSWPGPWSVVAVSSGYRRWRAWARREARAEWACSTSTLPARGQLLNLLRTGFDDPHTVGFRVGKESVLKDAGESQGDLLAEKGQLLGECGHVGLDAPKGCRPVCVHDDAQRLFPPQATPRFVKTQGSVF